MTKRLISAGLFITLYLTYLAWYDGWGTDPMTPAEVESYLANVPQDADGIDLHDSMRRMAASDDGKEIFMLNLNRYRYAADEPKVGVPAAYQSYGSAVIGMLLQNGSHPIYSAEFVASRVAGGADAEHWDQVILVRYRSRRDFIAMVTSDAYQAIARDRIQGIDYAAVYPTVSILSLANVRLWVLIILLVPAWLLDYLLRRTTRQRAKI